jgi:hypothetical protein
LIFPLNKNNNRNFLCSEAKIATLDSQSGCITFFTHKAFHFFICSIISLKLNAFTTSSKTYIWYKEVFWTKPSGNQKGIHWCGESGSKIHLERKEVFGRGNTGTLSCRDCSVVAVVALALE